MLYTNMYGCTYLLSLPARGAWIEIASEQAVSCTFRTSLPARGAWIEMDTLMESAEPTAVAPREGSVD